MAKSQIQRSAEAVEKLRALVGNTDGVESIKLLYTKADSVTPSVYEITRGQDCLRKRKATFWELQVMEETLVTGETYLYLQGLCAKKNGKDVLELGCGALNTMETW